MLAHLPPFRRPNPNITMLGHERLQKYWHVAAESDRLGTTPLAVIVLGEQIALWRGAVVNRWPWRTGACIAVPVFPAAGPGTASCSAAITDGAMTMREGYAGFRRRVRMIPGPLRTTPLQSCEQDGYIYVRLDSVAEDVSEIPPFRMPHWEKAGMAAHSLGQSLRRRRRRLY